MSDSTNINVADIERKLEEIRNVLNTIVRHLFITTDDNDVISVSDIGSDIIAVLDEINQRLGEIQAANTVIASSIDSILTAVSSVRSASQDDNQLSGE